MNKCHRSLRRIHLYYISFVSNSFLNIAFNLFHASLIKTANSTTFQTIQLSMNKSIADIRKDYRLHTLMEADIAPDAIEQFVRWWNDAVQCEIWR